MSVVYPPPTNYIKPQICFERTPEDIELLTKDLPFQISGRSSEELLELAENAQYATLFAGRLVEAVLRAGNDVSAAHECMLACFSDDPEKIHEIALDWATPDLSAITGEYPVTPDVKLEPAVERAIRVARKTFHKSAIALPLINMWVNMGLDLGLNEQDVMTAGASILDLKTAFGPLNCDCRYCNEKE